MHYITNNYMYWLCDLFREGIGKHYVDSNLSNHFGTTIAAVLVGRGRSLRPKGSSISWSRA